jgi:hypothetical protein
LEIIKELYFRRAEVQDLRFIDLLRMQQESEGEDARSEQVMKFLDKIIDCEIKQSKSKRQFLKNQLSNLGSVIGGGTTSLFGLFNKVAGVQRADDGGKNVAKTDARWLSIYEQLT